MTKDLTKKANWKLFLFGLFKIPLIRFCRPRIQQLSNESISVKLPLTRRTRNHVGSMYLAVMTVGADLASGFLAFHLVEGQGLKAAPVFKTMKAEYFKRAESEVYFKCNEGPALKDMIAEMQKTGERVNRMIVVSAICEEEEVARFEMEVSMKVLKPK
ncbi:MAG: hypothetical protein ACI9JN_002236 [Bacteroidia bacterium]|jgi:hypothetical protein